MRKACLQSLFEMAQTDPNIVFIGSDLGPGTLQAFKDTLPERFFMEGISEQHIIGMAAGLAMCGKIVYVNTIASFLTRRCYEQNMLDLGLGQSQVRLIGNGGGAVYAPLGPTHLALEDIAIMRAIPNMAVLAPCDAEEMRLLTEQTRDYAGPVYLRMAKGGDPIVPKPSEAIQFGKALTYAHGQTALFITTGILLQRALAVAEHLRTQGHDIGVLHLHTLKPIDSAGIIQAAEGVKAVFTFEEHVATGGLGSTVADILMAAPTPAPALFKKFSLGDGFLSGYGTQDQQLAKAGLDITSMTHHIQALLT